MPEKPERCPVCFAKPKLIVPLARLGHVDGDAWICCACQYEWPMVPPTKPGASKLN